MSDSLANDCLCCDEPALESRLQLESASAACCGQTAPISGYGDTQFSAFAYDTVYTVRTYNSTNPLDYTETTCTRSRSRTGADYAVSTDGSAPSCPASEFTDSGCEDIYGVLPGCNVVSPNVGVQCISNVTDTETSSTEVDCGDEAISNEAFAGSAIQIQFDDSPWLLVTEGMFGGSGYGGQSYSKTSFEIRKVGYPVPCWIVLTIERTDLDSNVTYLEDTIFLPWGQTTATYDLTPTYGEFLNIIDVKTYCAPKFPPP